MSETNSLGSNKGIYIFWGVILLVVVAVLLFIFIPRTDYDKAYNNVLSVKTSTYAEDFSHNTISSYTDSAQAKFASSSRSGDITALENIQTTLILSNNFCLTALSFIEDGGEYNSTTRAQSNAKSNLDGKINSFMSYCKTTLTNALNQTSLSTSEIASASNFFYEKYFELTKAYLTFYEETAKVISSSAKQDLTITSTAITTNTNYITSLKTEIAKTTLSVGETGTIKLSAESFYADFA